MVPAPIYQPVTEVRASEQDGGEAQGTEKRRKKQQ